MADENGDPVPHPELGDQFQDRAIRGIDPEGSVRITITEKPGKLADGTAYSLGAPTYELVRPDGTVVTDVMLSPRVAPQVFGSGLLEAIPAEDVFAAEDPDDADGDGISGRAHRIDDQGETVLGRFGWKAAVRSVEAQSAGAFNGDIGITSRLNPDQPCTTAQTQCLAQADGGRPELADEKLATVTFYTRTLAVPARRQVGSASTDRGEAVFSQVGCASCHTPQQRTGQDPVPALSNQTIRPYTDLLLHDMGEGLADGRPDGQANGRQWKTPPLWGVGLIQDVNSHNRLLHDGRARGVLEAVLWHGGEAEASRDRVLQMNQAEREALVKFVESL